MTVEELINELQKYDKKIEVLIDHRDLPVHCVINRVSLADEEDEEGIIWNAYIEGGYS